MKYIVLYNPYSANQHGREYAYKLKEELKDELEFFNMLGIDNYKRFLKKHKEDIIICGGDGTINYFINFTRGIKYDNDVLYYSTGTGNDFYNDIGDNNHFPFNINKYIKDLPIVTIKGEEHLFINGIGIGIDGWCCEVGDLHKTKTDKPVNYTNLCIKGLLGGYKPRNARVIVDGESYDFKNVYIVSTMNGNCYGGGIHIAPKQDRLNKEGKLTVVVAHSNTRAGMMLTFPKILKGKHEGSSKISMFTGKDVKVIFDKPCAVQIDGETIKDVSEYAVRTQK